MSATSDTSPASSSDLYGDVYPESWYALCASESVSSGQVVPVDALGRTYAVYRGDSGEVRVLDRHCPHMGASLARGRISGERLICPFHRWEFGPDGRCQRIPYGSGVVPPTARVRVHPCEDRFGFIWVYHGVTPAFPLPVPEEFDDPAYAIRSYSREVPIPLCVAMENNFDAEHLRSVHHVDFERCETAVLADEPHFIAHRFTQSFRAGKRKRVQEDHVETSGASASVIRHTVDGTQVACMIMAPIPLESRRIILRVLVAVPRRPRLLRWFDPLHVRRTAERFFAGSRLDDLIYSDLDVLARRCVVAEDALQRRFHRLYRAHLPASADAASTEAPCPPARDSDAYGPDGEVSGPGRRNETRSGPSPSDTIRPR